MPWELKRFQETRHLHFVTVRLSSPPTVSCNHQREAAVRAFPGTGSPPVRNVYYRLRHHAGTCSFTGERTGARHAGRGFAGFEAVGRREHFWEGRYYDFNVWSKSKRIEKLRYIHRNPVKRGLVQKPEDWRWSSFLHYATGVEGAVEIESEWTGRRRERVGQPLLVKGTNDLDA